MARFDFAQLFYIAILALNLVKYAICVEFETPEYILPCHKSDPEINQCIVNTFNHLRPYLIKGIPDIDLPSIEPLVIQKLFMENNAGAVRVRALFSNNTVFGSSNFTMTDINANLDTWKIEMGLTIPRIEVRGGYEVIGQVLLFPLRSKGYYWAGFVDITASVRLHGKIVKNKEGVEFMRVEKIEIIDFNMKKAKFKIRDLINSENVVGQAINQFLNNNANEIIQEMKPAASASISKHFKGFLNMAFLRIPLRVWLKEP